VIAWTDRWEKATASVEVCALSLWLGGLVVLGACAAPVVFRVIPAPWSGDAMGEVFRRFDGVAMASAVVVLGCEALRLALQRGPSAAALAERARAPLALGAAVCAIYGGLRLSPAIMALHAAGAVRGFGPDGTELERLHALAEGVAKVEIVTGLLLLVLQIATLGARKESA
jgi:Domain of unknown function (DUF4149)